MPAVHDLDELLATLAPDLDDTTYAYVVAPPGGAASPDLHDAAIARVEEQEGTTLVVPADVAERLGVAHGFRSRRLTLQVHSALEAVGLTAAFATALASEGIPANVLAGFHHDHILVPEAHAELARAVLVDLTRPPTVRPADPADADHLLRMVRLAGAVAPDRDPRTDAEVARDVAGRGRPDDPGFVAAGASGRVVGAAWCRPPGDGEGHTLAVAVIPSLRGRGTGRRLLEALLAALRDAGVTDLRVSVRRDDPARRLYRRVGFVDAGTEADPVGGSSPVMRLATPAPSGDG